MNHMITLADLTAQQMGPIVGLSLIFCGQGLAIVLKRDLWPFSHYPMFSGRSSLCSVRAFRVLLEYNNGTVAWWVPDCYSYTKSFDHDCRTVFRSRAVRVQVAQKRMREI